jgi:hypothetical protein
LIRINCWRLLGGFDFNAPHRADVVSKFQGLFDAAIASKSRAMTTISPIKTGLVLGAVMGLWHLTWSL